MQLQFQFFLKFNFDLFMQSILQWMNEHYIPLLDTEFFFSFLFFFLSFLG